MKASGDDYLHGTGPDEQRRLSRLNELLNSGSLGRLAPRAGDRILDVGAGLAQLTRGMARAAGRRGKVIGIERSREQLAEAHRQAEAAGESDLVEMRRGAVPDLPLTADEWGSFDIVHTRFLLEHLTDPASAVRAMVRAARPGGRIVLEDDDHELLRMWPEPPELPPLWNAYMEAFRHTGRDPFVGRRLVALLHDAGAAPSRNHWNFFGGCSGSPDFEALCANFAGILEGARATILEHVLIDAGRFDRAVAALREWSARPDAALWYCTFWAEGIRPAES